MTEECTCSLIYNVANAAIEEGVALQRVTDLEEALEEARRIYSEAQTETEQAVYAARIRIPCDAEYSVQ